MKTIILALALTSAGCAMRFPTPHEQQLVVDQMRRSSEAAIWNGAALCAMYPSCLASRYSAQPHMMTLWNSQALAHQVFTIYPSAYASDTLTVWNHQTLAFERYTIY